jgi:hypothetical protein
LQAGGTVDVGNFPATQPVSIAAPVAVTQSGVWSVTINGQPIAISAAALPLPAGAATSAGQAAIIAALGSPMQETGGSVSIAGTPTVDVGNFPATQPISAAALPLPAGAATNAELVTINATLGSPLQAGGTVEVGNFPATQPVSIAATVNVDVANFPATQPVTGTVAVSNLPPEGQATSAASLPVVIASDQSAVPVSVSAIALPANAAQETGGNLDSISRLVYVNHLILAELRALRMMQASVMTGAQVDPLTTLQDTVFN